MRGSFLASCVAGTMLLVGQVASAVPYDWVGGAGGQWGTNTSWNPNTGVPGGGDAVTFGGTGVAVDVNAGAQAALSLAFTNALGSYSLSGSALTVGTGGITQSGAAVNEILNQLIGTGPATWAVSAGTLKLANTGNTAPATVTASVSGTGNLTVIGDGANSGIGSAAASLSGGTLSVQGLAGSQLAGLKGEYWQNSAPNNNTFPTASYADLVNYFAGIPSPTVTQQLSQAIGINFPNSGYGGGNAFTPIGVDVGTSNVTARWTGTLRVTTAGTYNFHTNSDDASLVWVDGALVLDNNGGHGQQHRYGSISLSAGDHTIDVPFDQGGGGWGIEAWYTAPGGSETYIGINDGGGAASFLTIASSSVNLTNPISLTGSATIEAANLTGTAGLGPLTLSSGVTLTTQGLPMQFASATLNGPATIQTLGPGSVTMPSIGETVASTLTKTGSGVLALTTANAYTGQTNVSDGVLEVRANDALGTTAGGTVVTSGGSLRLVGGFDYSTTEALTLTGDGHATSNGALNNGSGDNNFRGAITLNGNATIRSSANTLRLYGTVDNAGSQLTFRSEGNTEVYGRVTGSGAVRKEGNGWVIMLNGTGSDYTGVTTIVDGVWDARGGDSLGSAAGGTVVENGGTLMVRDGASLADNLTLNGLGQDGWYGAIRSENNANTLTGTVAVNGTSRIHVNDTSLRINGQVTGGTIDKTGTGTLILTNAANSYSSMQINEGALRITNADALGNTTALTVASGRALEFDGNMTINPAALATLTMTGGALRSVSGTTTLDTPITLGATAPITFGGAGDLIVTQPFGNGGVPYFGNALEGRLLVNQTGIGITGDAGIADALSRVPTTTAMLTGDLYFPQDADGTFSTFFGGQPGGNNFTALFRGTFNATTTGTYAFALTQNDDQAALWLDLDQNGTFSTAGGELITAPGCCNGTTVVSVALNAGQYNVAWAVEDTGGGSGLVGRFQDPPPPFPNWDSVPVVNPTAQAGRWLFTVNPNNNVTKDGTGTTTFAAANTYNGTTTVNAGTLIAANDLALGTTDGGTIVKGGATLGLQGGVTIAGETLSLDGLGASGRPGALASLGGVNTFTAGITAQDASAGQIGIGADGGSSLTLDGAINLRYSKAVFNGAGSVVVNGAISGLGANSFSNGFNERIFNGVPYDAQSNIEGYRTATLGSSDAQGTLTTHLHYNDDAAFSTRAAALGAVGFDAGDFSALWVTDFTPNATGQWGFRFNRVDDNASMWIDTTGTVGVFDATDRFYYRGCCDASGDQLTAGLTAGTTYKLGFVMSDGGGDGHYRDMEVRAPGGSWTDLNPSDPALSGLFGIAMVADNSLVKNGTGTVTLAGNNTYNGPTTVNQGTLVAAHSNALGATSAGTTVADDATLAFQGGVSVGPEPLTVGHFTAPGKEGIANLGGANSFAGNVQAASGTGNVGIRSDAGSLTLTGTVALNTSSLTVAGDGDTIIANTITGGAVVNNVGFASIILSTPNLRAYYRLGEAAGAATAVDSGPNGYNGAYEGSAGSNLGAASAYAPLNTALHLDGGDDRVALTNAANLGVQNSSFTALAWINADTLGGDKTIFGTDQTGTNVGLHLITRGTQAWMGFYANDTGGAQTLSASTWYLMTWRYDISNGQQAIFINGALDNATTGHAAFQGNDTIRIGRWGGGNYFDGVIDEAAFFNRALTDAEIAALYAAGPVVPGNQTYYSNLVKRGLGTLTLGGNNTYNGTTTVEAGTLLVNGTTSGQGNYAVWSGAILGGTGSIGLAPGGSVTFQGGSFLSPGTSPGTLTILGDLVLEDGATYLWELGPGAYDSVALTGTLTLGNWILRIMDDGGTARESDKFYLFTGVTVDDVIGSITPTIDWSLAPLWAQNTDPADIVFDIDDIGLYMTGLASTPEPATLTLLALGGLALLRRRRRTR